MVTTSASSSSGASHSSDPMLAMLERINSSFAKLNTQMESIENTFGTWMDSVEQTIKSLTKAFCKDQKEFKQLQTDVQSLRTNIVSEDKETHEAEGSQEEVSSNLENNS